MLSQIKKILLGSVIFIAFFVSAFPAEARIAEWQLHAYIEKAVSAGEYQDLKQVLPLVYYKGDHWQEALNRYFADPNPDRLKVIEIFLNVDSNNLYKSLALFQAVKKQSPELLKLLLKNGANPNILNSKYQTPLQSVDFTHIRRNTFIKTSKIIKLLILSQEEKTLSNNNLLIHAIHHNDIKLIQFLLQHGADVNAKGGYRMSPLQLAQKLQKSEIIDVLINHGAALQPKTTKPSIEKKKEEYGSLFSYKNKETFDKTLKNKGFTPDKYPDAIFRAVYAQWPYALEALLNHGWDANANRKKGSKLPILIDAIKEPCYECIKILFQHGANPNISERGISALDYAIDFGDFKMVEMLISNGAKITNQKTIHNLLQANADWLRLGSIHMPSKYKGEYAQIANFLVQKGLRFNPNSQYLEEAAMVSLLKRAGYLETARILDTSPLKKVRKHFSQLSINPSIENILKITPGLTKTFFIQSKLSKPQKNEPKSQQQEAVITAKPEIKKEEATKQHIVEKGSPEYWLNQRFYQAVFAGNIPMVRKLLKQGADVNTVVDGTSALKLAINSGNQSLILLLLTQNTKANEPALAAAALKGDSYLVETLLKKGAKPNASTLKAAVLNGDSKIVSALLEKGAKPNTDTLKTAVQSGNNKLVATLLEQGAKPNQSTMNAAIYRGDNDKIITLIKSGAKIERPLKVDIPLIDKKLISLLQKYESKSKLSTQETPILLEDKELISVLSHHGTKLKASNKAPSLIIDVDSFVELAAARNKKNALNILKLGFDINKQDKDGNTALIKALQSYYTLAIHFLLKNGANPNIQNNQGNTALTILGLQRPWSSSPLNLLLLYGADPKIKNKEEKTVIDYNLKQIKELKENYIKRKLPMDNYLEWQATNKDSMPLLKTKFTLEEYMQD